MSKKMGYNLIAFKELMFSVAVVIFSFIFPAIGIWKLFELIMWFFK